MEGQESRHNEGIPREGRDSSRGEVNLGRVDRTSRRLSASAKLPQEPSLEEDSRQKPMLSKIDRVSRLCLTSQRRRRKFVNPNPAKPKKAKISVEGSGTTSILMFVKSIPLSATPKALVDPKAPEFAKAPITPMQTPAPLETRSEEHTSELQSRFGISYAVFC